MWGVIRKIARRKQDGRESTTLPRMVAAFTAGMVITAVLAYLPLVADILSRNPGHEPAIPAPAEAPDLLNPARNHDGSTPAEQTIYALVYAPCEEATFSAWPVPTGLMNR